ncbi:hypothetical protein [Nostoc sp. PCC 7524]|nr:hypothetical protein [Nostoc sp. PCC 7524]
MKTEFFLLSMSRMGRSLTGITAIIRTWYEEFNPLHTSNSRMKLEI